MYNAKGKLAILAQAKVPPPVLPTIEPSSIKPADSVAPKKIILKKPTLDLQAEYQKILSQVNAEDYSLAYASLENLLKVLILEKILI